MIQPNITSDHQLSDDEVALINDGNELAEQYFAYVSKLRTMDSHPDDWISIELTDLKSSFASMILSLNELDQSRHQRRINSLK